jgi:hypothetical protein
MREETLEIGRMGEWINAGLIKVIPKGSKRAGGWQPIMLLNISYKILVTLVRRIKLLVLMVVWAEQTIFIKGRFTLDNLITTWECID